MKNPSRKKTSIKHERNVGSYAYELQKKGDEKINPIDLQRAIHKGNESEDSFENQIFICMQRGIKQFEGDFFIVVLFKKERLIHNVVRQYFFPRKTCPTPEWDQVLYRYHRKSDELEFIWVIPDRLSCEQLPHYQALMPLEDQMLAQFAKDFNSGKLDKLCQKLNSEIVA